MLQWQTIVIQVARIIVVTAIAAGLCWLLGKTVVQGIRKGAIRHTDSTKVCRKATNPIGFWSLVVLFSGLFALFASGWVLVLGDAIRRMK